MTALRSIRQASGISLSELSRRTGINRWSLTMYEFGRRQPRIDFAQRIAEALGVPVEQVFPPKEAMA